MDNQMTERATETMDLGLSVPAVETETDIVPLNYQAAWKYYSEQEKQEITTLSNQIDVRDIEHVLQYGSSALTNTFEQCGEFLKTRKGSEADLRVMEEVRELSKQVADSKNQFNEVLKDPNLMEKGLQKLFKIKKKSKKKEIRQKALTSYELLSKLLTSSEQWLEALKNQVGDIEYHVVSDRETISTLEKYIIAGEMAKNRIESEIEEVKRNYDETGLQDFYYEHEKVKEGYEKFLIKLDTLSQMRAIYYMSQKELLLNERSNINIQATIHTNQMPIMATFSLQLRNALINEEIKEIYEAQRGVGKLSDALIEYVAKETAMTSEKTERALYASMNDPKIIMTALNLVSTTCDTIEKISEEELPKMMEQTREIEEALEKIAPQIKAETLKIEATNTPSTGGNSSLKF